VKYGLEPPSQLGGEPMPAEVRPLRFDADDDAGDETVGPSPRTRTDDHGTEHRRAESA
jgi:hypothetical protein